MDHSHIELWQLINPTLPIGAFAYSQGLEYAVEAGWIKDEDEAKIWLTAVLENVLAVTEIPIIARCYEATREADWKTLVYWNRMLLAMRESSELYAEDIQLGSALIRIMPNLDINWPERFLEMKTSYSTAYAFACAIQGVVLQQAAEGFLWSWCENQVAAAIKLVPLGQSAGQRILTSVVEKIPSAVSRGLQCSDDDIGMLAPGFAMASAQHEIQYSRLFRS